MILTEKGGYDALPLKSTLQPLMEIPDRLQQKEQPAALLRPAQRPLSAVIQKSLPAVPINTIASAASKHVVTEPNCDGADVKKVLRQRATTVFKENVPALRSNSDSTQLDVNASTFQPKAPVHQTRESICEKPVPSLPEPAVNRGSDPRDVPLATKAILAKDFSHDLIQSIEESYAHSEKLHNLDLSSDLPPPVSRTSSSETIEQVQTKSSDEVYLPALESQASQLDAAIATKLPHQDLAEVQEYWEEEEDEEYYDAEGYTTARSFRSRGDNTTGGLTMLLEPRVTTRSTKELEAAKQFVEMTRTEEDIEDEAWDTSMVAEYGDDIFKYMRELEVSCNLFSDPSHMLIYRRNA
jgi:G2/mitotic-specific cyclin 3/4